ncbi:MAG: transcriptional regulator [Desulfurococcales archaeon]|nr:transcriptional regulator [Desulfurococcales archaeon]
MNKDQGIGWSLAIVSVIVIILYAWGVFATTYDILLLKLTGFIAVAGVFGILAWIGYTLATTPPPKPIEEIEKELEEELKKLEEEMKEEGEKGEESKEETGEQEKKEE